MPEHDEGLRLRQAMALMNDAIDPQKAAEALMRVEDAAPGTVEASIRERDQRKSRCADVLATLRRRWGINRPDVMTPSTLGELVDLVDGAVRGKRRVRLVGAARSQSKAAQPGSGDIVVSTCRLDRRLAHAPWRLKAGQDTRLLYRTECGRRVDKVIEDLQASDLTLENLGPSRFPSIGGALSTGDHGSGADLPSLMDLVVALEVVVVDGDKVRVQRLERTCGISDAAVRSVTVDGVEVSLVQDDALFNATLVSFGSMGAIYAVTLQACPEFWLRETRRIERWSVLKPHLLERARASRHFELLVSPYPTDGDHLCLVTERNISSERTAAGSRPSVIAVARTPVGRAAAAMLVERAIMDPVGEAPRLVEQALRCSEHDGYVDRSAQVLWLDLDINASATEVAVPIEAGAASIDLVLRVADQTFAAAAVESGLVDLWSTSPVPLAPIVVRFAAASDALLAMTHGRQSCLIEIPMPGVDSLDNRKRQGQRDVTDLAYAAYLKGRTRFLEEVEHALRAFGGRPHWGLVHSFDHAAAAAAHGTNWAAWFELFARVGAGVFAGLLTDDLGASTRPQPPAALSSRSGSDRAAFAGVERRFPVRKDIVDLRDRWYEPRLMPLDDRRVKEFLPEVRDQGDSAACTGFALATVIERVARRRGNQVSAQMLYRMARRHDDWPGDEDEGSSLRGALRGWYHQGVCDRLLWDDDQVVGDVTLDRCRSARTTTLGAYYRLRPVLNEWHAALMEVEAAYVCAYLHDGWDLAPGGREITYKRDGADGRGALHAFAVIGYDKDRGFRIQNSWGPGWGDNGRAWWSYDDWADNVEDAWVFRLAVPTGRLGSVATTRAAPSHAGIVRAAPRRAEIAGHFVHFDNGTFERSGAYWTTEHDLLETAEHVRGSVNYRHVMLHLHGGLVRPEDAARRVAALRRGFQRNGVYPLHVMWDTGLMQELWDIVTRRAHAAEARAGGLADWFDAWLERVTHPVGSALWAEIKRDAELVATGDDGGALVSSLARMLDGGKRKLHIVAHSAGAVLGGNLLERFDEVGLPVASCSLLAPACTVSAFARQYAPRVGKMVGRMGVYVLDDRHERDDTAALYRKSLLYYVSRAAEAVRPGVPVPILGMQMFAEQAGLPCELIVSGPGNARSTARRHSGFDEDVPTLNNVLRAMLGVSDLRDPFRDGEVQS